MPEIDVRGKRYSYNKPPDHCPLCHHGIMAVKIGDNVVQKHEREGNDLQIVYRCPRNECQHAFIASYRQEKDYRTRYPQGDYLLRDVAPYNAKEPNTPPEIKELSQNYHKILCQSKAAEGFQLDQIAGCGYRKALEFLIKDYAIHKNPKDAESIKKKLISSCINDYVNDPNVKACASRAAWLGNDETHYVRKWETKDINDLKALIRLTENWILNELLTEKYLQEMP